MSVYSRLARAHAWLRAPSCTLCGVRVARALDFCGECEGSLPRLIHYCSRCAAPLAEAGEQLVCGACQQRPPKYVAVLAPFHYAPPIDRLIQGAKYGGRLDWLELLGRRLARHVAARAGAVDAVIAVPLHRSRLRSRGYNQSLELARPLVRQLALPLVAGIARVRATPPQAQLPAAERRRSVRHAFVAKRDFSGLRLALVDDVMTSGATVEAVTRCLLKAGAASVEVWVVARTEG